MVKALDSIDRMKFLKFLDISENRLTSLAGVHQLPALETVVASKNMIKSLDGLKELARLSIVDLRHNCVQNLDNLYNKLCPTVSTLYLDANPIIDTVNLLFLRPFTNIESFSMNDTPLVRNLSKNKYIYLSQY